MLLKKFLRFRYAAIKRYGDRSWTAAAGEIEFNPNYTVSCSGCEKGDFSDADNKAYIVELSNGTKFLCFMRELDPTVDILSEQGEVANNYTDKTCYDRVKRNIHNLNNSYNERNY